MANNKIRIIVAHPGRQHSFRIATALKEKNLLFKYVTTVYDKENSLIMRIIKCFISKENRKRASKRRCPGLNDSDVVLFEQFLSFILLLVLRIDKTRKFSNALNDFISVRFQRKLAKYVLDNNVDIVISFDANSRELFRILKKEKPSVICIMDNAAPNRHYLYKTYNENIENCGPFTEGFKTFKYLVDEKSTLRFVEEIKLADYHIVASSFSRDALLYDGVPSSNIFVIPYGINSTLKCRPPKASADLKLNLLYVGRVDQRKGIYQILEAAKYLHNSNIIFNIVGPGVELMSDLFQPYKPYVNFHGPAYFEKLKEHYMSNDVFLFPSMGDGFGLVLLEAMAAGLPVIASKNSGGIDIIDEGINGFLIDSCNTKQLIEKINWFYHHLDQLPKMSINAYEAASQYTWERYDEQLVSVISNFKIINK